MKVGALVWTTMALSALSAQAWAQTTEAERAEPPAATTPSPAAEAPAATDESSAEPSEPEQQDSDALQRRFSDAVSLLVTGQYERAARAFDAVAAETADPIQRQDARRLASLSRQLLRNAGGSAAPGAPNSTAAAQAAEVDNEPGSGRSRVVVASSLAGLYTGVALAVAADIDDARGAAALVTGLGAGGLAISLAASKRVRSVEADGFTLGLQSGLATGIGVAVLADIDGEAFLMPSLAGMGLYGTIGLIASRSGTPSRGDIAHAGTLALNGALTGVAAMVIGGEDAFSNQGAAGLILATGTAGLVTGVALAPHLEWSRRRALWLDGASVVGGLLGVGLGAVIAAEGDAANEVIGALAAAGLWGGYGLGVYFTRDVAPDGSENRAPTLVTPLFQDGARGLAIAGAF